MKPFIYWDLLMILTLSKTNMKMLEQNIIYTEY